MGCRKTQRSGSVTILRHRVITHTHRLDTHGQPTTAVPGVLLVCTTKTPSICWLSGLHLQYSPARLAHAHAACPLPA